MTYKTPDGKTIMTQQEHIALGQAKNQATEMLKLYIPRNLAASQENYEKVYKKWTKIFLRWNTELDTEIMGTGQQQKEHSTTPEPQSQSQSPSNYPEHTKGKYGERR